MKNEAMNIINKNNAGLGKLKYERASSVIESHS